MESTTYICLFDLRPYDDRVAPALRTYERQYDPKAVVALLREAIPLLPAIHKSEEDYQHWIVSLEPDAGYRPSDQTISEVAAMLILPFCIPHGLGFNSMQATDKLAPWLSAHSEWYSDLEDGGEELSGGGLEFTLGTGYRIATRPQIDRFLEEMRGIPAPGGALFPEFQNLVKLLEKAKSEAAYTLLRTSLTHD